MDVEDRVGRLISSSVEDLGYEVVRVLLTGKTRMTLQIMAERADGAPMTVEDCSAISRAVSALLDVEDPIPGAYTLEVSSPGIDRPLVRRRDFERFAGFHARLEMHTPVAGRRRFKGRILGISGDEVRLALDDGEVALAFPDIRRAKLVLTDELIAAGRG